MGRLGMTAFSLTFTCCSLYSSIEFIVKRWINFMSINSFIYMRLGRTMSRITLCKLVSMLLC